MAGRPTKISEELVENILAALREGISLRGACRLAGVNHSLVVNWLTEAEAGANGLRRKLLDGIDECRGGDERSIVMRMRNRAIDPDTPAAVAQAADVYLLQTLYPDPWRERKAVEVTGADGAPVEVVITCTVPGADAQAGGADGR